MTRPSRRALSAVLLLAVATAVAVPRQAGPLGAQGADIRQACRTAEPYYAVAVLASAGTSGADGDLPAVVTLGGPGAGNDPAAPRVLATRAQVGDVYGLGFDATRGHLYAAAYMRSGGAFGPGGPGQIYRIHIDTGAVEPWVALDAGPDRHGAEGGAVWVGRSGLGDVEVAPDGSELYVTNLHDRRLVRLALPGGAVRGSIRHGGSALSYERDIRPFGLGLHDGWLYHGAVNGQETDPPRGPRHIAVYRSRPDGSQMQAFVYGYWDYPRTVSWSRWSTGPAGTDGDEPMLVDIAFGHDGAPVIGLRDRQVDADPACVWDPGCAAGASVGDLLPGRIDTTDAWRLVTSPPWFQDSGPDDIDVVFGALAKVPGVDLVVAPSRSAAAPAAEVAGRLVGHWFDLGSGARLRAAPLAYGGVGQPPPPGLAPGGIALLCGAHDESGGAAAGTATADAARAATGTTEADLRQRATQRAVAATLMAPTLEARGTGAAGTAAVLAPTLTAQAPTSEAGAGAASSTLVAAAPRLTAAALAGTDVARLAAAATPLPPARATLAARARRAVEASCGSGNPYLATTRFVPQLDGAGRAYDNSWLASQPALVFFHDTPNDDLTQHFTVAREPEGGALFGLAHDLEREQLYAGAYIKRLAALGPLGAGGIYRYDLASGRLLPFARLDAGHDPHRMNGRDFDVAAAPFVGRAGLGDLELWPEGDQLLAVNLHDRLIYRLSVPDGRVLGAFAHGAAGQPWAADAVPFALAVRDGWVYHGVTDTGAGGAPLERPFAAYVYRSRADGSQMREVARLDLDYARQPPWERWDGEQDPRSRRSPSEPLLTDIEFREDGDLVLGLRDRRGDALVLVAGGGDIVLTTRLGERWFPMPVPELYNDNIRHNESSWGTLASLPWLDEVVSTVIDPVEIYSGGAAWFSNRDGSWTRLETVYAGANVTFGKASGLGDIESLCRALPPPPTATPTATPTTSPSATASPSPSPTVTATPTPAAWRIYLPLAKAERCKPEAIHADVVLVLDMSTSMYRRTLSDRTKHEAAIEAARLFASELDLVPADPAGSDRLAVVGFNDTAWTAVDLTAERPAIDRALDGLPERIAEGTRLDLALLEGQAALERAERVAANQPVLILLTDGLPNRVPTPVPAGSQEATVLAVAEGVKAAGTRVFTVGLGLADDVLAALLAGVATRPDDYYFAPDGDDLAAIYRQIAGRIITCP